MQAVEQQLLTVCRKPPAPTIRLGSLARKLPQDLRLAVADAVAYDPPASGQSSARLPGVNTSSASAGEQLPAGRSLDHMAVAVLPAGGRTQKGEFY